MDKKIIVGTLMLCGLTLAACSKNDEASIPSESATSSAPPAQNIQINDVKPAPVEVESQPVAVPTYIETKQGVGGSTIHLSAVKVTGQILSVEIYVEPPRKSAPKEGYDYVSLRVPLDQVSYIDDATSKKLSLLKDDAGVWMVSHKIDEAFPNDLRISSYNPYPLNFKFPAPSPETKTVSIDLNSIASFDGVAVSR